MKIRILSIFIFAASLFSACTREETRPTAYSEFIINPPQFSSIGAKSYWTTGHNFYWNETGDCLFINGNRFQIKKEGGIWRSYKETGDVGTSTENINDKFYIAYVGSGPEWTELDFDYSSGNYKVNCDEDDDNVCQVPLAAVVNTNFVTLNPCCAVLIVATANDEGYMEIEGGDDKFAKAGTINTELAVFEDVTEWMDLSYIEIPTGQTVIVLPMVSNEEVVDKINFHLGSVELSTTADQIRIKKGCVYYINLE